MHSKIAYSIFDVAATLPDDNKYKYNGKHLKELALGDPFTFLKARKESEVDLGKFYKGKMHSADHLAITEILSARGPILENNDTINTRKK